MVSRTRRLLDHQRRLERAETLMHDLRTRLRERPAHEHHDIKHTLRLANRDASMARRALMDLITESSSALPDAHGVGTRAAANGSGAAANDAAPDGDAAHAAERRRRL